MAAIPTADNFNNPSTTQQQFQTYLAQLLSYLVGLLGTDGTSATARIVLGIGSGGSGGVAFNPRGEWSALANYAQYDWTTYSNGHTYIARNAISAGGSAPDIDSVNWVDSATTDPNVAAAIIHADIAATQAGIATTQAGIATTQAGIATTQANAVLTAVAFTINHPDVRLAATGALPANTYDNPSGTITFTAFGPLTADGETVELNDDIVVPAEADQTHNGIFRCTTKGVIGVSSTVLTRRPTEDTGAELALACVKVLAGTANTAARYRVDQSSITLGTTAVTFSQQTGPVAIALAAEAALREAETARAIAAETEISDQYAPAEPISQHGLVVIEKDLFGGILRGYTADGSPYFPGVTDVAAAQATTIAGLVAALPSPAEPVSPHGLIPLYKNPLNQIVLGLAVDTGQLYQPASAATYQSILPNEPKLLLSDYFSISEQSAQRLRFLRPIVDANNYQHCSPGSRSTFYTNSQIVKFRVYWNNLVTRDDVENLVGAVFADDALVTNFTSPFGSATAGEQTVTVDFGSTALRKVALVWPYGTGMDLLELQVLVGSAFAVAPARPTKKLVTAGDSITHGFSVTAVDKSWPFLLANLKSAQLLNLGYGSRLAVATDGNALAGTGADSVVYMIGYNNFVQQTALATFQTAVEGWITNARAALSGARLYLTTPIYSPNTNTLTLQDYRDRVVAAHAAVGDANSYVIDGLAVMTNSSDRLSDGIHPNDLGASEIASNVSALITV